MILECKHRFRLDEESALYDINCYQRSFGLREFSTLNDCPDEVILQGLNHYNELEYYITCELHELDLKNNIKIIRE